MGLRLQPSGFRAHYSILNTLEYQWKVSLVTALQYPQAESEDLVGLGQIDFKHKKYMLLTCSIGFFLGYLKPF